jgi:hypothetical protein
MTNPGQPKNSRAVVVGSAFGRGVNVTIDPWAPNPLLDDLRQSQPANFAAASAEAPAPTLFESGDLPPFTASGVDPQQLVRLPYTLRHAAAGTSDPAVLLGYVEDYGNDPTAVLPHQGLESYKARLSRWAGGFDKPPAPQMSDEEANALYDQVAGGAAPPTRQTAYRLSSRTPAPQPDGAQRPGLARPRR